MRRSVIIVREEKGELADIKKKLASCYEDENEVIVDGIELLVGGLAISIEGMEKYTNMLAECNKNKRI